MTALAKIPAIVWGLVALVIAVIVLNWWVYTQRQQAVELRDAQINAATNKQVQADAKIIEDTFSHVTPGIRERVDGLLKSEPVDEPATAGGSSELRRTEEDPADAGERSGSDTDLGASSQLLDSEVDFIKKHSELLQ